MNNINAVLKSISAILLRSFIVSMIVLVLWIILYFTIGRYWMLSHSELFGVTQDNLRFINYQSMLVYKSIAICFLLCPLIAIQLYLRSQ